MKKFKIREKYDQKRWDGESCYEKFGVNDPEALGLWIADTDIPLYKEINDYIVERAQYPLYGYNKLSQKFKDSFEKYHKDYRNLKINFDKEAFFTPSTVYTYATLVQGFSKEGDNMLFNTPIYQPLIHTTKIWKRNPILLPLIKNNNRYDFDFVKIEKEIVDKKIKIFTLVSPLNPGGRIWERAELLKIVEICKKHNVVIIADEIHCDIIFKGFKFISMLEFSDIYDKIVIMSSLNKTFGISSIHMGWGIVKNKTMLEEIKRILDLNHIFEAPNAFAEVAMLGCFEKGERYLKDTLELYQKHANYIDNYLKKHCPKLEMMPMGGTFLPYINFKKTNLSLEKMKEIMWKKAKVLVQFCDDFEDSEKDSFRINVSTETEVIEEACERIAKFVNENI